MKTTIIGATGLVGGHLLDLLLKDDRFDPVRILIRGPFLPEHPKLEKKLVDFSDEESFRLALEDSDIVFCSIGTTQKKVRGDREAYRKVDFDIAVNAARLGKQCGCEKFILVSAIGASSKSNNFYTRLKGETEEAVIATGISSIHIMRPSLLLGERKEFRPGEKLATWLMPVLSFLLPKKFRPVHAKEVAEAMVAAAKKNDPGFFIHDYSDIKQFLKSDA